MNFMPLLQSRVAYKPFEYNWAYDAWLTQQRIHWLPEEVPLADDVKDWKHKLTAGEKDLCTQIFRFFTQADIEVNDCYMTKYATVFKPTEIKMMLSAFSNMETIHVAGYSHLIDTLDMPNTIYEDFLKFKETRDKHDYMQTFNVDTKEGIATTLAGFGAFTEGLQLFATFAILLNFTRFNKMKGMGQIVSWSIRDESLHTNSIIMLFKTFIYENPEIWTTKLRDDIYTICRTMVEHEDKFIDLAFSVAKEIEGLNPNDVKKFIRFIANQRLAQLNPNDMFIHPKFEPLYDVFTNPLDWFDNIAGGQEHANFFEARATEYSKSATTGSWDDAFELHYL